MKKDRLNIWLTNSNPETAINNQIENDNYDYYFINLNNQNAGYFGVSNKKDYLFLSKLYLLKDYRGQGLGHKAFNKIKEIAKELNHNKIRFNCKQI